MTLLFSRALRRSPILRGLRLAAASLLALHLAAPALAQDDVDPNCAAAGIYDYDSCAAYLSGGSEPAYEEPAYEEPAYEEPAYEEPAYEEPAYEEPAYEEPAYEDAYEEPAYEEPAYEEPAYEEPAAEEPVYEEPAYEEPAAEEPAYEEPVAEEPAFEEPAYEEPAAEEPAYEEPAVEEPTAESTEFGDETAIEEITEAEDPTILEDDTTSEDVSDEATEPSDETALEEETSDETDLATEEATGEEEATTGEDISEDEATEETADETDVAEPQLFSEEEATEFDEAPLADDGGVQEEVIEDLPEGLSEEDIAPALDSIKEYGDVGEAEAPEFVPTDDSEAQVFEAPEYADPLDGEDGTLLEVAPAEFAAPEGVTIVDNSETTVIYEVNNTTIINNYYEDQQRLAYNADTVEYYSYEDGSYSESVIADDGSQVITIRDRYGNIISRTYYDAYGNEYVLAWYDPSFREDERMYWSDVGYDLPPLLVTVPRGDYIFFYDRRDEAALRRFFQKPPVEPVRRLYTIDEVKRSARLRDSLPRVEIGDLTFANGSASINRNQARKLQKLAQAMLAAIEANPAETFLIEGHTDAPGSERSNLRLSDARAAAVAQALTEYYGVPPWNLTTQGYGERFLKVQTTASNANNRRVTIRRITPLVTTASR